MKFLQFLLINNIKILTYTLRMESQSTYSQLKLVMFTVILLSRINYSFISATWTAPPVGTPPANNIEAPINVTANYQAKFGDLGAVRIRANQYCDAAGNNCFTPIQAVTGVTCVNMPAGTGGRELSLTERPAGTNRYMFMPENVSIRCRQLGHDFGFVTNLFPVKNAASTDGWCGFNNARTANWVSDSDGSRWVANGCVNYSVSAATCCSI